MGISFVAAVPKGGIAATRGYDEGEASVYLSGQRRGILVWRQKGQRCRQAIESLIGHLKSDSHLGRNWF